MSVFFFVKHHKGKKEEIQKTKSPKHVEGKNLKNKNPPTRKLTKKVDIF